MSLSAFLVVEKGTPHDKGTRICLTDQPVLIGRVASDIVPDIGFDNFLISRKHCLVEQRDGEWLLCDLGSKHGTALNGAVMEPSTVYRLKDGDRISLAETAAVLRFVGTWEFEKTIDLSSTQPLVGLGALRDQIKPVVVDTDKMELLVAGEKIPLSVKEWELLALLYDRRNKVVEYAEIRAAVWPERKYDSDVVPDVGADEMNVLIYRLRKKLGDYAKSLRTVRGRGCILEL